MIQPPAPLTRGARLAPIGVALLLPLAALLTGCASSKEAGMPAEVQQAPLVVRQAYDFALEHPDVLRQLPCYCGCGAKGHTSNYSCYVSGTTSEGGVTFDLHAVGCSICVDITQDAKRMLGEGRSLTDIRAEIDRRYSAFGPSNRTP